MDIYLDKYFLLIPATVFVFLSLENKENKIRELFSQFFNLSKKI